MTYEKAFRSFEAGWLHLNDGTVVYSGICRQFLSFNHNDVKVMSSGLASDTTVLAKSGSHIWGLESKGSWGETIESISCILQQISPDTSDSAKMPGAINKTSLLFVFLMSYDIYFWYEPAQHTSCLLLCPEGWSWHTLSTKTHIKCVWDGVFSTVCTCLYGT